MEAKKTEEVSVESLNRYELVIAASKRARQINDLYSRLHSEEGGLPQMRLPDIDTLDRKPLTVAIEEIKSGKIKILKPVKK